MNRLLNKSLYLALFTSTSSILILFNGAAGTNGNRNFTGLFIISTTGLIFLCSRWREFRFHICDVLYVTILLCVAVSLFRNGWPDTKEVPLLILSLAAYPACRLVPIEAITPTFSIVTGAVVFIGAIFTAVALLEQWTAPHGKPMVFGFDGAATSFLMLLGFLLIAVACTKITVKQAVIFSALIFLPIVIFAASMVRFTFMAIFASLLLALVASEQRKQLAIIILVFVAAIPIGMTTRSKTMVRMPDAHSTARAEVEAQRAAFNATMPSRCKAIDLDNSIQIRRTLIADAVHMMPSAGLFGTGLDSFMANSCIEKTQAHNTVLQAVVEFGWLGGGALALLIVIAGIKLIPMARNDLEARFVLCSLAYVGLICAAHGRLSRDALLFLFLGYSVRKIANRVTLTLASRV